MNRSLMYKAVLLLCGFLILVPALAFSDGPDEEKIEKAVLTDRDDYGVPTGLYRLDQDLVRYRIEFENKQSSNRKLLIGSIVTAGCGGLLMAIGDGYELTYAGIRTGIPIPVFGGICLGSGAIGFVISLARSPSVRRAEEDFTQYVRDTYGSYLGQE